MEIIKVTVTLFENGGLTCESSSFLFSPSLNGRKVNDGCHGFIMFDFFEGTFVLL